MGLITATSKAIAKSAKNVANGAQSVANGAKKIGALANETGVSKVTQPLYNLSLTALTLPPDKGARQIKIAASKAQRAGQQSVKSGMHYNPATKTYDVA